MKPIEELKNKIIQGDCLEVLKEIPDNSIDTIITDPPYLINFMGKNWDKQDSEFNFNWAKEALRVAKPGATMLCFGGSRTWHRLACAIEDAGWIIKDTIMWVYGSGFPKATDIAQQISKKQGAKKQGAGSKGNTFPLNEEYQSYRLTPEAKLWNGWKSHGLKPAFEPIIMAMKPNEGSYSENALKWGVAGLNIDGGRIGNPRKEKRHGGGTSDIFPERGNRPEYTEGRYPANIILDEEAARELDKQSGNKCGQLAPTSGNEPSTLKRGNVYGDYSGYGKASQPKDKLSGASRFFYVAKASRTERNMGCEGLKKKIVCNMAKESRTGRDCKTASQGMERFETKPKSNFHPTVKPLKLMEYLCILTKTPTGGIILDPFVGSGTTCMAAKKIGRDFIGIEKEEEYVRIAKARIKSISKSLPL